MDITKILLRSDYDKESKKKSPEFYNPYFWGMRAVIDQKTGDVVVTVSERKREEKPLLIKTKEFLIKRENIISFIEKHDTSKFAFPRLNGLVERRRISILSSILNDIIVEEERLRELRLPKRHPDGLFLDCPGARLNHLYARKVREAAYYCAISEAFKSAIRYDEYYGRDTGFNIQRIVPHEYRNDVI